MAIPKLVIKEAQVLKGICETLDLLVGWGKLTYRRINVGPVLRGGGSQPIRYSKNPHMVGLPDLFVFLKPGIVLLFEVKAPNGKLSKGQEKFRDEMSQMSQHYYILKSIDDLIKILNSYQVMV